MLVIKLNLLTRLSLFILICALGISPNSLVYSQNTQQTKDPAETQIEEPAKPTAIPVPEITKKADETHNRLIEVRSTLKPDPAVTEIKEKIPETLESVRELKKGFTAVNLEELPITSIEDRRNKWLRFKTLLEDKQGVLKKRSEFLEEERAELNDFKEVWTLTYNAARDEKVPKELLSRIRSIQQTIKEVEDQLKAQLDDVLKLQSKISKEETNISEILIKIEDARKDASRLWTLESKPLWDLILSPDEDIDFSAWYAESWQQQSQVLNDFFSRYKDQTRLHITIFVLLLVMMIYLNRKSKKWDTDDESIKAAAFILSRPFSVSILISLIITRLIYTHPPIILIETLNLFLLIPLLRLLPGLIFQWMRTPLYGVLVIYILHGFYDQVPEYSLAQRSILLFVSLLALLGLIWFLRKESKAQTKITSSWWKAFVVVLRIFAVIIVISIISNLIGNVTLTILLINGVLYSSYTAIIAFTCVIVLRSLLVVFLRNSVANQLRMVKKKSDVIIQTGSNLINLIFLFLWIRKTLLDFALFDPLYNWVVTILTEKLTAGNLNISLGDVLSFFVIVWLSILISRIIRFVLDEDILPHIKLPRGVPGAISALVNYSIMFFGFLIALSAAGIEWGRFAIMAGALGVGIGFGMQGLVNNFISGLILLFERPIQVGDTVEVGTLTGEVKRIGIRSSTIRTWGGAEVIVPNGNLIANEVTNWTLSDRLRRIEVFIGVAYGTDPNRVITISKEIAQKHSNVLDIPEPYVLFKGFGDSSLDFELRFWTGDLGGWIFLRSDVYVKIHDTLKEAGIEIPFPQRDLHFKSMDPALGNEIKIEDSKLKKVGRQIKNSEKEKKTKSAK